MDDRSFLDLPSRMQSLHSEIFKKSAMAKTEAERLYNKTVDERVYESGGRVLILDFEESVKNGRKLGVMWLWLLKMVERVIDINYILEKESNGLIVRSYVDVVIDKSLSTVEREAGGAAEWNRRDFL